MFRAFPRVVRFGSTKQQRRGWSCYFHLETRHTNETTTRLRQQKSGPDLSYHGTKPVVFIGRERATILCMPNLFQNGSEVGPSLVVIMHHAKPEGEENDEHWGNYPWVYVVNVWLVCLLWLCLYSYTTYTRRKQTPWVRSQETSKSHNESSPFIQLFIMSPHPRRN